MLIIKCSFSSDSFNVISFFSAFEISQFVLPVLLFGHFSDCLLAMFACVCDFDVQFRICNLKLVLPFWNFVLVS